jgi:hypothetical protein
MFILFELFLENLLFSLLILLEEAEGAYVWRSNIAIWYIGGPSTIEKGMMIPEFSENREKIKYKNYIKLIMKLQML